MHIGSGVNMQGGSFALLLPLGYGLVLLPALPSTNVSGVHICILRSLVRTTATVALKSKFGLSAVLELSSYSYRFWNWCGTAGFGGGGSFCKELYWCSFRNWMHF